LKARLQAGLERYVPAVAGKVDFAELSTPGPVPRGSDWRKLGADSKPMENQFFTGVGVLWIGSLLAKRYKVQ